MPYPVAPGRPNYSGNFIPEIWAGKVIENFYDATVCAAISNTDYEGEIKKFGDTVNIRTTPDINVRTYTKGQALTVDNPDKPKVQLLIDKGEYFSCIEDDVDKVQADIHLMDLWSKDASERMKIAIDRRVLPGILPDVSVYNRGTTAGAKSASFNLGVTGTAVQLGSGPTGTPAGSVSVTDFIVDMGTVLDEANCPEAGRWLIIPAKMAGMLKKSDLKQAYMTGDDTSPLRNGRIGMIDRFTIYVSHNLLTNGTGPTTEFNLLAGHQMGLTFASQMTEMETLRAQSTFGDIIRGLQVYGYKVVKGEALATACVKLA